MNYVISRQKYVSTYPVILTNLAGYNNGGPNKMNPTIKDYKNHIWKNGWVSGKRRWLFHAYGMGTSLDGMVNMEDGSLLDWDITGDRLTIGNKIYTIFLMTTNAFGSLILKDAKGGIEIFHSF